MKRALSLVADLALIVLAYVLVLPLLWILRAALEGVAAGSRAYDIALYLDLALARAWGAEPGETFSTYMARLRPARLPCLFCWLVSIAWPGHCDQAAGVKFRLIKE